MVSFTLKEMGPYFFFFTSNIKQQPVLQSTVGSCNQWSQLYDSGDGDMSGQAGSLAADMCRHWTDDPASCLIFHSIMSV